MQSSWHVFDPKVIYWGPRQVHSLWGVQSIFITETAAAQPTSSPRTAGCATQTA
jgi:hypothetical protein